MPLMTTTFVVCGKVNYTNLSRYSDRSERTYRRHFEAGLGLEFIFRDARQFTVLADCQARSPQALDSHVNASLTALSLAKAALKSTQAIRRNPSVFRSPRLNGRRSMSIF